MALKIRLARGGAKKRPYYRIVVAEASTPRDGRFVEKVGAYNPMVAQDRAGRIVLNEDRIRYWLSVGAQPTDRVALFLGQAQIIPAPERSITPQKSAPKKKAQERLKAEASAAEAKIAAAAKAAEEARAAAEAAAAAAAAAAAEPVEAPVAEAPADETQNVEAVVAEAAVAEAAAPTETTKG